MRFHRLVSIGLMLLLLASLLGCAHTQIKYVRELPPEVLLLDCPKPEYSKTTNLGLAQGLASYHWALEACNNDKAALRQWAEGK